VYKPAERRGGGKRREGKGGQTDDEARTGIETARYEELTTRGEEGGRERGGRASCCCEGRNEKAKGNDEGPRRGVCA